MKGHERGVRVCEVLCERGRVCEGWCVFCVSVRMSFVCSLCYSILTCNNFSVSL